LIISIATITAETAVSRQNQIYRHEKVSDHRRFGSSSV
jgi:hypothetical protein